MRHNSTKNEMMMTKILEGLLLLNAVKGVTLNQLSNFGENKTQRSANLAINRAEKKGLVKRRKVDFKKDGRRFVDTFYHLTKEGYQYILECGTIPWFQKIALENNGFNFSIFNRRTVSNRDMERFLEITSAAYMAYKLGANVAPQYFVTEQEECNDDGETEYIFAKEMDPQERYLISTLVNELYTLYQEYDPGEYDLRYWSSLEIKREHMNITHAQENSKGSCLDGESTDEQKYDISGRIVGILESDVNEFSVYVLPAHGLRWSNNLVDRDKSAAVFHRKEVRRRPIDSGYNAIMFVENPKIFQNGFFDIRKRRRNNRGKVVYNLGEGYEHFCLVPLTKNGASHLRWLMDQEIDHHEEKGQRDLESTGDYTRVKLVGDYQKFALQDDNGVCYAIGTLMELSLFNSIQKIYLENPEAQIGVFCFSWQAVYYQRLFPRLSIVELNDQYEVEDEYYRMPDDGSDK